MIDKVESSEDKIVTNTLRERYDKDVSSINKKILLDFTMFLNIICTTALIIGLLFKYLNKTNVQGIVFFVIAFFLIYSILIFPRTLIDLIIFYRTKYTGYLYDIFSLFCYFASVMYIPLMMLIQQYNSFTIISGLLIYSCLFLSTLAKNGKKSLFYEDIFKDYYSTILTQQSLLIKDKMDGYSQRPMFSDLTLLKQNSYIENVSYANLLSYIKFLARKGELIGWNRKENLVTFYPRVLLNHNVFINYPFSFVDYPTYIHILKNIFLQRNLTTISINLDSNEIALFIRPEDYLSLNNVTFHLFCQELLERIKLSINAFIKNDLALSYSILYPVSPDIKSIYRTGFNHKKQFTDSKQKNIEFDRPQFLFIPVLIENCIAIGIVGLVYLLLISIESSQITVLMAILMILSIITEIFIFKLGFDLWYMKFWAYLVSFILDMIGVIAFILLILFIMPNINILIIDVFLIVFSILMLYYLYKIHTKFNPAQSFFLRFIKNNSAITKLNK